MSKRQADQADLRNQNKSTAFGNEASRYNMEEKNDMGEFEDAWEDEMEEEEIVESADVDSEADGMEVDEKDDDDEGNEDDLKLYMPGQPLAEGEVLEADPSVYVMLHNLDVRLPFLSFDILEDKLGNERKNFPATAYVAAGTSLPGDRNNEVLVMKMSSLHKTQQEDSDDEDDPDALDEDPILEYRSIPHNGCVNRLRVMPQQQEKHIAATWAETGKVHIWDLTDAVASLDVPGTSSNMPQKKPLVTINNHGREEGYALDWSSLDTGRLLSGDNNGRIYHTILTPTGVNTENVAFREHKSSVEDIQWSPTERNVFASCSSDQTVKIWDTRNKKRSAVGIHASNSDVNVITWNKKASYLMASGHDDGIFSVWDLRTFKGGNSQPTPVATFKWHNAPITSIEWHPTEESVLAVSGADNQLTLWDLSVEPDTEQEGRLTTGGVEVPPQLLFVHQGQEDIKELHFHKQIPGCVISTASTGMNIFKTISV
ncbi:WD40-repeat-containing domain protein [Cokeromyces recurvatus]|uniref:WD40-repeat-containing domain protein n=1 Tax=Cokeromyces recurvatus TaxID=90255 RepID=UPI00221EDB2B|nr:WD40-repeat-containing domain protein [Cokeromyces recurvatus]KAI7907769.1 WD40-repeat-containing domain protein [Cokeromyces recurvatus]